MTTTQLRWTGGTLAASGMILAGIGTTSLGLFMFYGLMILIGAMLLKAAGD